MSAPLPSGLEAAMPEILPFIRPGTQTRPRQGTDKKADLGWVSKPRDIRVSRKYLEALMAYPVSHFLVGVLWLTTCRREVFRPIRSLGETASRIGLSRRQYIRIAPRVAAELAIVTGRTIRYERGGVVRGLPGVDHAPRGSGYVKLPFPLEALTATLRAPEIRTFLLLESRTHPQRGTRQGIRKLAGRAGLGRRTVRRDMAALERNEIVFRKDVDATTTVRVPSAFFLDRLTHERNDLIARIRSDYEGKLQPQGVSSSAHPRVSSSAHIGYGSSGPSSFGVGSGGKQFGYAVGTRPRAQTSLVLEGPPMSIQPLGRNTRFQIPDSILPSSVEPEGLPSKQPGASAASEALATASRKAQNAKGPRTTLAGCAAAYRAWAEAGAPMTLSDLIPGVLLGLLVTRYRNNVNDNVPDWHVEGSLKAIRIRLGAAEAGAMDAGMRTCGVDHAFTVADQVYRKWARYSGRPAPEHVFGRDWDKAVEAMGRGVLNDQRDADIAQWRTAPGYRPAGPRRDDC